MLRPELIVVNANIVTMDPLTPRAEALAVVDGRVAALGTSAEIQALACANTQVVDAGGRLVLPGFQDTHIHLQDSGYHYGMTAALDDACTPEELQAILSRRGAPE